jgi:hypothetical protein
MIENYGALQSDIQPAKSNKFWRAARMFEQPFFSAQRKHRAWGAPVLFNSTQNSFLGRA